MSLPPRRYAVVGHPVAHSRSPFIHAAFARQTGEAVEYGRIECAPGTFETTVRDFATQGAGGCNVTVPFKFEAAALATERSPRVALAGAANVLRFDGAGAWYADNTDGVGLVRDIEHNAGCRLAGRRLLLVGAGGAAAGVLGPLLDARPQLLVVVNRTPARADDLVARHAAAAARAGVELRAAAIDAPGRGYEVVVNATASSLQGAAVPVPRETLGANALAVDLMYGPPAQPFLQWGCAGGAQTRDGLGMLVEQAAESFYLWRGVRPQTAPVLAALRKQLASQP